MPNRPEKCPNFNHGRLNAPVRFCPACGKVVNKAAAPKKCNEASHAARRRRRDTFCVDCGTQL